MKPTIYLGCPAAERSQIDGELRAAGVAVRWADDAHEAIAELDGDFCPVLVDMKSADSIAAGGEIRRQRPGAILFAVADLLPAADSPRAMPPGFAAVLERPLSAERCAAVVRSHLPSALGTPSPGDDSLPGIVAVSPAMRRVTEAVRHAGVDPSGGILISGEPGTGKRFLACAIHSVYSRPGGRVVEVDCSAPDLEHALFGTASDTPADQPFPATIWTHPRRTTEQGPAGPTTNDQRPTTSDQRPTTSNQRPTTNDQRLPLEQVSRYSLLHQAFGGTLLLLNLVDMPARVQARLVRVLRDHEVSVVGGGRLEGPIRPVACVEPGFDVAVEEGRVRPDLFKRLATTRIEVPSLRNRREDIPGLVDQVLTGIGLLFEHRKKTVSHPAMTLLASLPYPGNVRELRRLLRTVAERTASETIRIEDLLGNLRLEVAVGPAPRYTGTLKDARVAFEQQYIKEVLEQHHGRVPEAARTLGIQRTNLYRKMRNLGVARRPANGSNGSSRGVR